MKLNFGNLGTIIAPIAQFFHKFHTIVFFVFISSGLFVAILILLSIIALSDSTATTQSNSDVSGQFDQETIQRVNELGTKSPSQPGDRESPFVE